MDKDETNEKVYDDIFEAIHELEPGNPIYNCKAYGGSMIRHQIATLLKMSDGSVGAFILNPSMQYYRGENDIYPTCKANLFRIKDKEDRIIEQIKAEDFILFLKDCPENDMWLKQYGRIDYTALAQHYDFATNMLDVSNDIIVAAFFATHYFDKEKLQYVVKSEGEGRIRWTFGLPEPEGRIHFIGLQPFARPGRQSGYGIFMSEDDDFAKMGGSLRFRQNYEMNMKFSRSILQGEMFLPFEHIMQFVKIMKDSPCVTSMAVQQYCKEHKAAEEDIRQILEKKKIMIVDVPVVGYEMLSSLQMTPGRQIKRVAVMKPAYSGVLK